MKLSEMSKTEDLIQNVKDLYAMECHALSAFRKSKDFEDQLEEPASDDEKAAHDAIVEEIQQDQAFYASIQQEVKALRYDTYAVIKNVSGVEFDEHASCLFKHGAGVARRAEELIETEEDALLYEYMMRTGGLFNKITSKFLGLEITECSTCVSEMTEVLEHKGGTADANR